MVQQITHDPKVKGLNPVFAGMRLENIIKISDGLWEQHSGRTINSQSQGQGFKSSYCWQRKEKLSIK